MTQAQLDRAVARATGESASTISRMGFGLLAGVPLQWHRKPRIVNWDRLNAQRASYLPQRSVRRMTTA